MKKQIIKIADYEFPVVTISGLSEHIGFMVNEDYLYNADGTLNTKKAVVIRNLTQRMAPAKRKSEAGA